MRLAINKTAIAIAFAGLLSSSAHAWMDDWAPKFDCTPAEVEELPAANVSNFVCTVHVEDLDRDDSYWERCEGYSLDLNDDGIKDSVYFLPWMGCGLAACGYDVHFRVSAGANEWTDTVIAGTGISKDDLVNVAGKTYFRHSDVFWHLEISKHNHWVYQVFSFDKQGEMICSNGDFGKLFPAVTIYYINPKFKRVELTKGDLKQIEEWTDRKIRRSGFELLNYRYLFN